VQIVQYVSVTCIILSSQTTVRPTASQLYVLSVLLMVSGFRLGLDGVGVGVGIIMRFSE
jgi:hypothetical protein